MNLRNIFRLRHRRRFRSRFGLNYSANSAVQSECLENRTLLAGDVTAAIQGQNAIINGDSADNSIELTVENGNVAVRGLDGTTVNGSTDTFILVANIGGVSGNLRVSLGNGNDRFNIQGVGIGANLIVNGGIGNDEIGVSDGTAISRNLVINGGRGDDTVSVQDSEVNRNTVLRGQHGADVLVVSSVTIGRHLVVSGGRGNDDIVVDNSSVAQDARLAGWGGNDDIVVRNSTISDDLAIAGHSGHDNIMIDTSTIGDRSRIVGRSGNDNIVVEGASRFGGRARIHGGAGADNFQSSSTSSFGRLRTGSFSGATADATVASRITDTATGAIAAAEAVVASFDQRISLSLNSSTLSENAGTGAATLTVSRSSSTDQALEVTLTSSDTSRLTTQQATVTIAAGQTSADVLLDPQDNSAADGDATVTITATAADLPTATIDIAITDDDQSSANTVTLTASESQILEDTGSVGTAGDANTLNFQLSLQTPATTDETYTLTYTLDSGGTAADFFAAPGEVTVAANQSSADYLITTLPNTSVEADQVVTVSASLAGSEVASTTFTLIDNDTARISVSLDVSSVTEDGPPATATVTRNTDTTNALSVTLSISDANRVTIDGESTQTIEIPAGVTSVTQELAAVNDTLDNGDTEVTITAFATGLAEGTATLAVVDNDIAELNIALVGSNTITEDAGADAITARISRNTSDTSNAVTVALNATGDSRLSVPATVVIEAGQSSVDVTFDAVNNDQVDNPGTGIATVTGTSGGFADATATVAITDDDISEFQFSPDVIEVHETDGTGNLTLTRNSSANSETVSLTFSDTTLVTGAASVVFAAGDNIRTVPFTIIDNQIFDDNSAVTVTATSPDSPTVTATITVVNDDVLSLTTDFSANNTVATVGALVTRDENFVITGQTSPGATVQVDTNGNAAFDEGTTTADASGNYSITVPLIHDDTNDGMNPIQLRAVVSAQNVITTSDITDVHRAVGTLVRFETNQDVDADGNNDFYDVELLNDGDVMDTVDNFLSYVNDGSYDNMFIHRSPPGFVIQGGGFAVENGVASRITTRSAIDGQFKAANSNVRGTLSMAHTGDPNTGTSQWFVNVRDNSTSLDAAEHTVFGRVIGGGMNVVDRINAVSTADLSLTLGFGAPGTGVFAETPLSSSPFVPLSGTIAFVENSSTLTGTDTRFTTELQVNDVIDIVGSQAVVTAINSDTEITIDVVANSAQSDIAVRLISPPNDDAYFLFTNIGEILDTI